jgi:hypothetical protein
MALGTGTVPLRPCHPPRVARSAGVLYGGREVDMVVTGERRRLKR